MKYLKTIFVSLILILTIGQSADLFAQSSEEAPPPSLYAAPRKLYRVPVGGSNNGYYLTNNPNGGVYVGGIYLTPATGYTPDPASGAKMLHYWRVNQGNRIYYYYNSEFYNLGGDYTYLGVIGYVFGQPSSANPPSISTWYSTTKGYWYGWGTTLFGGQAGFQWEAPPSGGYTFQGTVISAPNGIDCDVFPFTTPCVTATPQFAPYLRFDPPQ
jgi:hypothetical protein